MKNNNSRDVSKAKSNGSIFNMSEQNCELRIESNMDRVQLELKFDHFLLKYVMAPSTPMRRRPHGLGMSSS